MKLKFKKIFITTLLVVTMMVPTIASAAYGYLTHGVSEQSSYNSNAWADYQYHQVYVRLIKCGNVTPYAYNWQHVTSKTICGFDNSCYAQASYR